MENSIVLAGLHNHITDSWIYGRVVHQDANNLRVHIQTELPEDIDEDASSEFRVLLISEGSISASQAHLRTAQGSEWTLAWQGNIQLVRRRGDPRYPCRLAASVRPWADAATAQAEWYPAETEDISSNGISLVTSSRAFAGAEQFELVLWLADPLHPGLSSAKSKTSPDPAHRTPANSLRAIVRIARKKPHGAGKSYAGMMFSTLESEDRQKLCKALTTLRHESAKPS